MTGTTCRSCRSEDVRLILSLGTTPLADALVAPESLGEAEAAFPLEVAFCEECSLVQLLHEVPPEALFVDNYLYYSSFSPFVLDHSKTHATNLVNTRNLNHQSLVVEVASNDGYLLRNFVEAGVPVLGIDPAPGQASAAQAAGVPTLREFFGADLARRLVNRGQRADVIIANNVLAHVPDLNGFVEGLATLLAPGGLITIENPWIRDLVEHREFDTIYHEHHCYFSCTAIDRLMRRHGLFLNHVEYFPDLHGGTLRWHIGDVDQPSDAVAAYLREESETVTRLAYYERFAADVEEIRSNLVSLLQGLRAEGKRVAAYGAAAKGSTLLNYAGIGTDLIDFVVDRNVHKVGLLMPGVHISIKDVDALVTEQPDYVLLLAWNFKAEIIWQQQEYLRRGGRFIVPVPVPLVLGDEGPSS